MKKLVELIKIGKSEHKRSDLISSYFSFIDLLNEKNENNNVINKSWSKDNKEICELFSKNEIYFNKKCSSATKVGREKSLFKSLNLITKNDIIEPTEFAKKIIASESNDEKEVEKIKLNNYEYNFLLIILFIENQSP